MIFLNIVKFNYIFFAVAFCTSFIIIPTDKIVAGSCRCSKRCAAALKEVLWNLAWCLAFHCNSTACAVTNRCTCNRSSLNKVLSFKSGIEFVFFCGICCCYSTVIKFNRICKRSIRVPTTECILTAFWSCGKSYFCSGSNLNSCCAVHTACYAYCAH